MTIAVDVAIQVALLVNLWHKAEPRTHIAEITKQFEVADVASWPSCIKEPIVERYHMSYFFRPYHPKQPLLRPPQFCANTTVIV